MTVSTETRDLRLLLALGDEKTLHEAARQLHVTPSALSQQLRALEQRLGGPLFRRQWRRLVPNAAGQHVIAAARSILVELARVEAEARQLIGGATGAVRLATACQQSYRWLPEVLARYAKLEPSIELTLSDDTSHDTANLLLSRKADVALFAGEPQANKHLSSKRLFRDELVAVVSRCHPWAKRRRVGARDFASEQLFTDHGALARSAPLGALLVEAAVTPRKTTFVPTIGSAALDLASANLGVVVAPLWTVAPTLSEKELAAVRIGARGLRLQWSLATRNERLERPVLTLLEVIRSVSKPLASNR
jgi:LysR family transcriptional regulator, regulator for metE and metH